MDEPTAALGASQSEIVCDLMRTVAARGLGVLVVSHDLPRILKAADTHHRSLAGRDRPAGTGR